TPHSPIQVRRAVWSLAGLFSTRSPSSRFFRRRGSSSAYPQYWLPLGLSPPPFLRPGGKFLPILQLPFHNFLAAQQPWRCMRVRAHHRDQVQGLFRAVRLLHRNSGQSKEFCPHSKRSRRKEDRAARLVSLRRSLLLDVPSLPGIRRTTDEPSGSWDLI